MLNFLNHISNGLLLIWKSFFFLLDFLIFFLNFVFFYLYQNNFLSMEVALILLQKMILEVSFKSNLPLPLKNLCNVIKIFYIRDYERSCWILAIFISQSLSVSCTKWIQRIINSKTQTRKNMFNEIIRDSSLSS